MNLLRFTFENNQQIFEIIFFNVKKFKRIDEYFDEKIHLLFFENFWH